MEPSEILDRLAELAQEAGFDVRVLARGPAEASLESAVCRVRGRLWVVLAQSDPPEQHIAVLARALREHAAPLLEDRFLPPAVREVLEAG